MERPPAAEPPGPAGDIFVGVGGWTYEPWRGAFFPEGLAHKRELEYASRKLTSIEINGTFYRTQSPATFAKWREETPDGFVFSVKAPRYVAQKRTLGESGESVARFFESGLAELGPKLGPILWQFAPTRKFDPADFGAFLALLPRELNGRPLRHALEVRHESFATEEFVALARAHGAAIVVAADSAYPQIADLAAPFAYIRAMGTRENEELGYGPQALDNWATRARALARGEMVPDLRTVARSAPPTAARDVFFYFISGFKTRNPQAAMALIARL